MTALVNFSNRATPPAARELKIGDLAKATGKSARALRLYEEMGLLTPGTRTAGGFRVYGPEAVDRVRWISQLQELGFTLSDVQDMVKATASEGIPKEAMSRLQKQFRDKLSELNHQLERLTTLRAEVAGALHYLEGCGVCSTESEGPSACVSCDEHGDHAPSLVRGVTQTASEAHGGPQPNSRD